MARYAPHRAVHGSLRHGLARPRYSGDSSRPSPNTLRGSRHEAQRERLRWSRSPSSMRGLGSQWCLPTLPRQVNSLPGRSRLRRNWRYGCGWWGRRRRGGLGLSTSDVLAHRGGGGANDDRKGEAENAAERHRGADGSAWLALARGRPRELHRLRTDRSNQPRQSRAPDWSCRHFGFSLGGGGGAGVDSRWRIVTGADDALGMSKSIIIAPPSMNAAPGAEPDITRSSKVVSLVSITFVVAEARRRNVLCRALIPETFSALRFALKCDASEYAASDQRCHTRRQHGDRRISLARWFEPHANGAGFAFDDLDFFGRVRPCRSSRSQ